LKHLKNRAKSGDMAVLELTFRNVSLLAAAGKVVEKLILLPVLLNRIMSVYGFSRTVVPHFLPQIVD